MTSPSTTSESAASARPHTAAAHWPAGSRTASVRATTRKFATGVTVLTCSRDEGTHGVTVSTLTLASMKPPMVSVALRRDSQGLAALLAAGTFAVNVLGSQQDPLARHFARSDRGEGLTRPGRGVWAGHTADGVPLLGGAVGWLQCRVTRTVPTGDHELVLGLVTDARLGSAEVPLVNFAGALHRLPAPAAPASTALAAAPPDDTTRS
ncbi:flavin reductase family protein [Streptomyces sp. NPDC060011]|uniref:flavin reductase family protein n=1 Tax=unclassified Streptomyces TaxID=2593676 RepID=UPI0022525D58|nr:MULTISPECIES: flavin reductase family protein [unclassified Streptomyces]MCX4918285.1 flavin reductase family protein [Streptomyces sp. NBC_00687]MCX5135493.1 flavin reductase family protein [Streptomyces sp. NBC_00340]MCX5280376.1 flavin reductase family protein [Streptomyces sp. NBC_00198]WSD76412.1 flavin reductase family protein [Streptomyces sp. NBC_01558]